MSSSIWNCRYAVSCVPSACSAAGLSKSRWEARVWELVAGNAIAKEAQRVMEDSARHVLIAQDARLFSTALDTPPAPTLRGKMSTEDIAINIESWNPG
ncbi:MAG: hypothetical protein OXC93_05030 [Rhodospirillaceae bacterium]|nr:hypothetical protein [Rhodospirillaceae bacterium]